MINKLLIADYNLSEHTKNILNSIINNTNTVIFYYNFNVTEHLLQGSIANDINNFISSNSSYYINSICFFNIIIDKTNLIINNYNNLPSIIYDAKNNIDNITSSWNFISELNKLRHLDSIDFIDVNHLVYYKEYIDLFEKIKLDTNININYLSNLFEYSDEKYYSLFDTYNILVKLIFNLNEGNMSTLINKYFITNSVMLTSLEDVLLDEKTLKYDELSIFSDVSHGFIEDSLNIFIIPLKHHMNNISYLTDILYEANESFNTYFEFIYPHDTISTLFNRLKSKLINFCGEKIIDIDDVNIAIWLKPDMYSNNNATMFYLSDSIIINLHNSVKENDLKLFINNIKSIIEKGKKSSISSINFEIMNIGKKYNNNYISLIDNFYEKKIINNEKVNCYQTYYISNYDESDISNNNKIINHDIKLLKYKHKRYHNLSSYLTSVDIEDYPHFLEENIIENVILFDLSLKKHLKYIKDSILPNTITVNFNSDTDSFEDIKNKLLKISKKNNIELKNVSIMQHNRNYLDNYTILQEETGILKDVELSDPSLNTWINFKSFVFFLQNEINVENLDLLMCNIYSNNNWKYIIDKINQETPNITIRSSEDVTGHTLFDGDWILESPEIDVNLVGVYFNKKILDLSIKLENNPNIIYGNVPVYPKLSKDGVDLPTNLYTDENGDEYISYKITEVGAFDYVLDNPIVNSDVLLVGGGGGTGGKTGYNTSFSGGAGGGGVLEATQFPLVSGEYKIQIGFGALKTNNSIGYLGGVTHIVSKTSAQVGDYNLWYGNHESSLSNYGPYKHYGTTNVPLYILGGGCGGGATSSSEPRRGGSCSGIGNTAPYYAPSSNHPHPQMFVAKNGSHSNGTMIHHNSKGHMHGLSAYSSSGSSFALRTIRVGQPASFGSNTNGTGQGHVLWPRMPGNSYFGSNGYSYTIAENYMLYNGYNNIKVYGSTGGGIEPGAWGGSQTQYGGGGGGGAGEPGQSHTNFTYSGKKGGDGRANSFETGNVQYYGAGGGGGAYSLHNTIYGYGGSGGLGGGGDGGGRTASSNTWTTNGSGATHGLNEYGAGAGGIDPKSWVGWRRGGGNGVAVIRFKTAENKTFQSVPLDVAFTGNSISTGDSTTNRLESFVVNLSSNMSFSDTDISCVNGAIINFTQVDSFSYSFDVVASIPNTESSIFLNPASAYYGTLDSLAFTFTWNYTYPPKTITDDSTGVDATIHSTYTDASGDEYVSIMFTNPGTQTITLDNSLNDVDILVVGGGGGGDDTPNTSGSGGGGGGVVMGRLDELGSGTYTLTVGNGGNRGEKGEDSQLSEFIALGGGSGATSDSNSTYIDNTQNTLGTSDLGLTGMENFISSISSLAGWYPGENYDTSTKTWTDKSPNSNNVTSLDISGDPTITTLNGKNVITGGTDTMIAFPLGYSSTDGYGGNGNKYSEFTLFTVSKYAVGTNKRIFTGSDDPSTGDAEDTWYAGHDNGRIGANFSPTGGHFDSSTYDQKYSNNNVISYNNSRQYFVNTRTRTTARYNGKDEVTVETPGSAEAPYQLYINGSTGNESVYECAEVIYFNETLTTEQIEKVEWYLLNKYLPTMAYPFRIQDGGNGGGFKNSPGYAYGYNSTSWNKRTIIGSTGVINYENNSTKYPNVYSYGYGGGGDLRPMIHGIRTTTGTNACSDGGGGAGQVAGPGNTMEGAGGGGNYAPARFNINVPVSYWDSYKIHFKQTQKYNSGNGGNGILCTFLDGSDNYYGGGGGGGNGHLSNFNMQGGYGGLGGGGDSGGTLVGYDHIVGNRGAPFTLAGAPAGQLDNTDHENVTQFYSTRTANFNGVDGLDNTGGGGGGGSVGVVQGITHHTQTASTNYIRGTGGSGGSGVVIIRYKTSTNINSSLPSGLSFSSSALDENNNSSVGLIDVDLLNTDFDLSVITESDLTVNGGSIVSFTKINNLKYTARVSANTPGSNVSVMIPKNKLYNSATGNRSHDKSNVLSWNWNYNIVAPDISINSVDVSNNGVSSTSSIDLELKILNDNLSGNSVVSSIVANDITITNGEVYNVTIIDHETIRFGARTTSNTGQTTSIKLGQNKLSRLFNNVYSVVSNNESDLFNWSYTAADLVVTSFEGSDSLVTNGHINRNVVWFKLIFSEDVFNFSKDYITGTNCTVDKIIGSGNTYSVKCTTYVPISASIQIANNINITTGIGFTTNITGNNLTFNWNYDDTPPTITFTGSHANNSINNNASLDITITSSQDINNFLQSSIIITGSATITSFTQVSAKVYDITVTPTSSSTITITLDNTLTDIYGNSYASIPVYNWTYDNVDPTIFITSGDLTDGETSSDDSIVVNFITNKEIFNFNLADDAFVTNGTLSNLEKVTNVSVQNTFNVTVVDKTTDHPYYNSGGSDAGYLIDGDESPELNLIIGETYYFIQTDGSNSGHPLKFYESSDKSSGIYTSNVAYIGNPGNTGSYTRIKITSRTPSILYYQCEIHDYMGNYISVAHNNKYRATLKPTINNSLITLYIKENSFEDEVGNTNSSSSNVFEWNFSGNNLLSILNSTDISNNGITSSSSIDMKVSFTSDITSFDSTDISFTNGTIDNINSVDNKTKTFTFTSSAYNNESTIFIPENSVTTGAVDNKESNIFSWTWTIVIPSVTISSSVVDNGGITNNNTIPFTFTLNNPNIAFLENDIIVTNGTVDSYDDANSSSGIYTCNILPSISVGQLKVKVSEGSLIYNQNGVDYVNDLSFNYDISYDSVEPTLTLTTNDVDEDASTNRQEVQMLLSSDKNINDLRIAHIYVANGVAHTLSDSSGTSFTFIVKANDNTVDNNMQVYIESNSIVDDVGNSNSSASNQYDFTINAKVSNKKSTSEMLTVFSTGGDIPAEDIPTESEINLVISAAFTIPDTTNPFAEEETTVTSIPKITIPPQVIITNTKVFSALIDQIFEAAEDVETIKINKSAMALTAEASEKIAAVEEVVLAKSNQTTPIDFSSIQEDPTKESAVYIPLANAGDFVRMTISSVEYEVVSNGDGTFDLIQDNVTNLGTFNSGDVYPVNETGTQNFIFGSLIFSSDATTAVLENPCFLKGTEILTKNGYKKIENLIKSKDILIDHEGNELKIRDVKQFIRKNDNTEYPYKIPKDSKLSEKFVVTKDLYITYNHCVYLPHVNQYVPVSMMKHIKEEIRDDENFVYYHIYTDNYFSDTIIANGIPCETHSKYIFERINNLDNGKKIFNKLFEKINMLPNCQRSRLSHKEFNKLLKKNKKVKKIKNKK